MSYAVVVVYYRNWPDVMATLEDLEKQSVRPEAVVVVDNSPGDERLDEVSLRFPRCHLVRPSTNAGYGAGMNLGIVQAGQLVDVPSLLLLTHEVRLEPTAAEVLLRALEAGPQLAVAAPLLGDLQDASVTWSAGAVLEGWRLRPRHRGIGTPLDSQRGAPQLTCDWVDGAALMVRSEAIGRLGGFREDFFLYWEEVDLCLRLRHGGWQVACVPTAVAWQRPSGTPTYLECRNRLLLLRAHASRWAVLAEVMSVGLEVARAQLGVALGRRDPQDLVARRAGLMDGFTGRLRRQLVRR